jgi:hypothetical protein
VRSGDLCLLDGYFVWGKVSAMERDPKLCVAGDFEITLMRKAHRLHFDLRLRGKAIRSIPLLCFADLLGGCEKRALRAVDSFELMDERVYHGMDELRFLWRCPAWPMDYEQELLSMVFGRDFAVELLELLDFRFESLDMVAHRLSPPRVILPGYPRIAVDFAPS